MAATVNMEECIGCEACVVACPEDAISMADDKAIVDAEKCIDCGICVEECPTGAISL